MGMIDKILEIFDIKWKTKDIDMVTSIIDDYRKKLELFEFRNEYHTRQEGYIKKIEWLENLRNKHI